MDPQTDTHQPDEQPADPADIVEHYGSTMDDFVPPIKPKHVLKGLLKLLLILIVIAAIAGGAFWFFTKPKIATVTPVKTPATTTPATTTPKITSATKQYDSSTYNLSFNYPTDWTVSDTDAKLTATSPAVQLTGAGGQSYTGQIVFTVQNKQTSIAQFATGKAVAALESQKIAYTKPTANQRAQTYVSFVNYSGLSTSIDALYIAGDNGYQAAQSIPMSDVIQADPLVTISFAKCTDVTCKTTPTAAGAIETSAWSDTTLSKPLITLLESLVIN